MATPKYHLPEYLSLEQVLLVADSINSLLSPRMLLAVWRTVNLERGKIVANFEESAGTQIVFFSLYEGPVWLKYFIWRYLLFFNKYTRHELCPLRAELEETNIKHPWLVQGDTIKIIEYDANN